MEEEKTSKNLVTTLSIVIGLVLIVILIIIKVNIPSFSILSLILSISGIILFFGIVIFIADRVKKGFNIKDGEQDRIPKPISLEQAREIAKKATVNPEYADYLFECLDEHIEEHGKGVKNLIYIGKFKSYYEGGEVVVLINMNYPNERRCIITHPNEIKVNRAAMMLPSHPADIIQQKETRIVNPVLGIEQITTEPQKDKKKEKEDEDKEKGL